MPAHRIYPHGPIEELIPGLWLVRGGLPFPLMRNMAIARLPWGELLLHSLVALDDPGMAALERLGAPAYAVVPHAHHQMDAPFFKRRYPGIKVLCPARDKAAIGTNVELAGTMEDVLPQIGVRLHSVPGIRMTEYVLEIAVAGGTVLVCNDAFAGPDSARPGSLAGRLLVGPLGAPGNRFGVARIYRLRWVSDMALLRRFAGDLATIPSLAAITVSHGEPVLADPAGALKRVASAKA